MLMPALLPERLLHYQKAETEKQLLELLSKNHTDFVFFFETCCDDETWSNTFPTFMEESLKWLTDQLYTDKLHVDLAKIAAEAIQKHYQNLSEWLPLNILSHLNDGKFVINSFLFQAISTFFLHLIHQNCFKKETLILDLTSFHAFEFKIIQEYIYKGEVKELWRIQEDEILKVLETARICELPGLALNCEQLYLRYVSLKNYMDYMRISEKYQLELVKKKCCALFNSIQSDVVLTSLAPRQLAFELTIATQTTLEQLRTWTPYITHFIAGPDVMENGELIAILNLCRKIISIDLGRTRAFSRLMLELQHFKELVLAGSFWLNDMTFKHIVEAFSQLQKLDLTSCNQITSMGWGELTKLRRLTSLDLSRCDAIDYESFGLILSSARHLNELSLNECRGLSKDGFHALAESKEPLIDLNLARTGISDAALLEITARIPSLSILDLTRCQNLTEEGIFDALKIAPSLTKVILSHTTIGQDALDSLKKLKPHVKFIF